MSYSVDALRRAADAAQANMTSIEQELARFADLRAVFGGSLPEPFAEAEERLKLLDEAWKDARNWAEGQLRSSAYLGGGSGHSVRGEYADLIRQSDQERAEEDQARRRQREADARAERRASETAARRAEAGAHWLETCFMPEIRLAAEELKSRVKIVHRLTRGMPEPHQSVVGFTLTSTKDAVKHAGYELIADDTSFKLQSHPGGKLPKGQTEGDFRTSANGFLIASEMLKEIITEFLAR